MQYVKIASVFSHVNRGKTPSYVETSDICVINQACIKWDEIDYSKVKYQDSTSVNPDALLKDGDVLINSTGTGTLGRCNVFFAPDDRLYMADTHVTVLRGSIGINPYIIKYFFMRRDTQQNLYSQCVNGSTNQIELSKEKLRAFRVPVPTQEEQRCIVESAQWISQIIAIRQKQLNKLDELIKARFVELFGDPITNSKGFETRPGIEVFKLSNGKFVPENKRFEVGVPVYGGNGISWYTDEILCANDTVVVGRVGFQSGNVHLVEGPLWISDNAMYISDLIDDEFDLRFLYAVMEHIDFTRFQDAGDLKKITQKPFMQMQYIKPPLHMQHEYIAFVSQVDKSKLSIQASLDQLETLKQSLMQKYFG